MSNRSTTPRDRARALLGRMTVAEKAQQLSGVMPNGLLGPTGLNPEGLRQQIGEGIGQIASIAGIVDSPDKIAGLANGIQRFLVEETRLGIPAIIHAEALNGLVAPGYTSFPTAIGLAATWNPGALQTMADLIRRQMRSVGLRQALSPVLDVSRDARWGRVHETYGEDPYLASAMGVAFVKGLQGDDPADGVIATAKHFLGYAMTEAGQNMAATQLGSRELYDVYATPFEAVMKLAALGSVMNSYSEIDGVPAGASRALLTDLLRDRMGFEGTVVSDYNTVEWLATRQFVAADAAEAGVLALSAGLDVELPTPVGYGQRLVESVAAGRIDERVLDDSVLRVLTQKFALGIFESPYVAEDAIALGKLATEGGALARSITEESITLIKNDGILPLSPGTRIAVIGPHGQSAIVNFAAYTYPASLDMMKGLATGESRMAGVESMMDFPPEVAELMAAEFAKLAAIDSDVVARQAYGTHDLAEALRERFGGDRVSAVAGSGVVSAEPSDLDAAVRAAEEADVVVLAIGGRAGWFGTRITEGEGTDAATIELTPSQVALVEAVAASGTPLVATVYQGRPLALTAIDHLLSAAIVAYYPGPQGADSIAAVLSGSVNPSGHLPYTMPRATGQVPIHYSQKHGSGFRRSAGDMFRSYVDLEATPLYPFGHGLSYTEFEYSELAVETASVPAADGVIRARVRITNVGTREGDDVVQLYAAVRATAVTRPALQLVGFERIRLAAGTSAEVEFELRTAQLGYSGIDGRFVLDADWVDLSVGRSSSDLTSTRRVTVTDGPADLEGRRSYLSTARTSSPATT